MPRELASGLPLNLRKHLPCLVSDRKKRMKNLAHSSFPVALMWRGEGIRGMSNSRGLGLAGDVGGEGKGRRMDRREGRVKV